MEKIAIHGRQLSAETIPYYTSIIKYLSEKGIQVKLSSSFRRLNEGLLPTDSLDTFERVDAQYQPDAMFSLGGDGTILNSLTIIGAYETPILGINMGRLGFLATISVDMVLRALDQFFDHKYWFDMRTLLALDIDNKELFGENPFALNELAILRKETSSMLVINAYLNGEHLTTYWSDGVMVSTPTGSTGYSLSCGGPILMPQTNNFIITPVSPHNLNLRPLIVADTSEITFEVESKETGYLISMDSRSEAIDSSLKIKIRKASFKANLIRIEGDNFLDTLRNKLSWGLDKRN
ncbi:MAG: NAD+ kinase [Cyclobacteriaceae bacterium]